MALRATFLLALLALALGAAGAARADGAWEPVTVERHQGGVDATLSFERQRNDGITNVRRLVLSVKRAGHVLLPAARVCWGPCGTAIYGGRVGLELKDVWGSSAPEALVSAFTGGAHCCSVLAVAVTGSDGKTRLLKHDFTHYGWTGGRHGTRYDLVGADARFAYTFTYFAASWPPPQVVSIDGTGRRFIDVTRSRPDVVEANAAQAWSSYLDQRDSSEGDPRGAFAGWCADEYLLGRGASCETSLTDALRQGSFDMTPGIDRDWPYGSGFGTALHAKLRAWGYR